MASGDGGVGAGDASSDMAGSAGHSKLSGTGSGDKSIMAKRPGSLSSVAILVVLMMMIIVKKKRVTGREGGLNGEGAAFL